MSEIITAKGGTQKNIAKNNSQYITSAGSGYLKSLVSVSQPKEKTLQEKLNDTNTTGLTFEENKILSNVKTQGEPKTLEEKLVLAEYKKKTGRENESDSEAISKIGVKEYQPLTQEQRAAYYNSLGSEQRAEFARRAEKELEDYNNSGWFGKSVQTVENAISSGIDRMARGFMGTSAFSSASSKMQEIAMTPTQSEIEGQLLQEQWDEEGKWLASGIHQVISSTAQNAIPIAIGAASGVGLIGTLMFGTSVFGNEYQDTIKEGYTPQEACAYALASATSEMVLEKAIGGLPVVGGVLTGEVSKSITKKIKKVAVRAGIKWVANGFGEFVEEGTQEILNPLLRNLILGESNKVNWSDALYSGLIGMGSALLMGGIVGGNIKTARAEINYENIGSEYKNTLKELNIDIHNVVSAAKTATKGTELYNIGKELDGKTEISDLDAGRLAVSSAEYANESKPVVEQYIGAQVRENGGANYIISQYDTFTKEHNADYPDSIKEQAEFIRNTTKNSYADVDDSTLGRFALDFTTQTPRALIRGTAKNLDSQASDGYNNNRGDENAGNQVRDGSGRLRGQSENSQSGTGAIQETATGVQEDRTTGGTVTETTETLRNSRNNRGITEEQSESLKTSVIRDEDNMLKPVFHFTENMEFETFAKGDTGFHFGSIEQANSRASKLNVTGRTIKAYLDIKNPIRISTDIMSWQPSQLSLWLYTEGVITAEQLSQITELQQESGGEYNSPAAETLRSILNEKGYDGIVYENLFEGEGKSYIAFYPEQVVILDNGITESEAPTEAGAFSMQSEERGQVFTEPDTKEIARDYTNEDAISAMVTGETKNARQKQIESVAGKFGLKIRWSNKVSRGTYNHITKTITINPDLELTEMYVEVFKHEFVHYLERKQGYKRFRDELFASDVFANFCRRLAKSNSEFNTQAIDEAVTYMYRAYRSSDEVSKPIRDRFTRADAEKELIAEFVSKELLKGDKRAMDTIQKMAAEKPTLVQRIRNWIKEIIQSLKGVPQNKTLLNDLEYLEKRLGEVIHSANKLSLPFGNKVQYSAEYNRATVNTEISELVKKVQSGDFKDNEKVYLSDVSNDVAEKIYNLTGIDVTGIKVAIEARQIEHILKGHGENGASDHSMSNIDDISKIEYTLNNYDSIVPAGKTKAYRNMKNGRNKTVDTVLYEKNIGENSYYVIQAVPDAKSKTLYIVSAFIGKSGYKKEAPQVINANSPDVTPEVEAAVASTDSISNISEKVNENLQHSINLPTRTMFNAEEYANNLARVYNKKANKQQLEQAITEIEQGIAQKDFRVAEDASIRAAEILMKNADEYMPVDVLAHEVFSNVYRGDSLSPNAAAVTMRQHRESEISDYKKRLSRLEKSNARKSEQLKKRRSEVVAEETARRNERRDKQQSIEYIRREVGRIDKKLRANSDKNPVPQELQETVKSFCSIFLQNDQTVFDKKDLGLVALAYSNMAGDYQSGGESLLGAYDFNIEQELKTLASTLDGKTLRNLSVAQLSIIRDVVDNLRHMIVNENKLFLQGRSADIAEVAAKARGEIRKNKTKVVTVFSKKHGESILEQSTTPIYFFDKLGATFRKLFDDIRDGQDKWFRNMEISKTYIQDIKERYHYSEWGNDTFSFKTVYGDEIELTREQALLLYATAKREYNNKEQGSEHLFKGGIVIDGEDIVSKTSNKLKKADKKKAFEIFKAFVNEIDSKSHQITPIDVGTVNEWLTEEQKAYADELVKYLSVDMAALGNETSMQLFGIRKYNEDYYIPYNSAQNFLYSQPGVTNEQRLKHQSFTKQTQKKARTPLMLTNFSEVCADHINRMCMYNAMTVPLENMNRVFNYSESGEEGFAPQSIKTDIESAFGKGALEYVQQFLTDMNGSVRSSSVDTDMSKWLARFKKGATFASASVVVQQPSAIARAFALVDEKYFLSSTFNFSERDYQELIKYAPVAGIKTMGRFDTGMGVENVNWLLQENIKGLKNKAKAFVSVTDSTYRDDTLTFLAAKADEITWGHIWAAVKAETADKTDLKQGSEEFLEYAGKRFRDVIDYTQVYDSTLSRSQIMRSKSAAAKMVTAFMAEPTVSLNLLMDAAQRKNSKYFARALRSWMASIVLNALLKSFVTAGRDDDEDKSYFEKYIGQFVGNAASDLFVPNMIPLVKDVVSIFEGYTVERVDMSLFADLADTVEDVFNDNKTTGEKITSVASSLGAFLGLPVKNILRDIKTARNVIKQFFNPGNKTTALGVKYSVAEELPFGHSGKESDIVEDLATAANKSDNKRYSEIYDYLEEQGKTESTIFSETKTAYKKDSDVKSEAQKQMKGIKNTDTFKSLDADTQANIEKDIADHIASEKVVKSTYRNLDVYDELYELKRKNKKKYDKFKQQLLDKGYTSKQISEGEEVAKIAYLKSVGIDLNAYILSKAVTSVKNADTDNSGGVSAKEKRAAIKGMDLDEKVKKALLKYTK